MKTLGNWERAAARAEICLGRPPHAPAAHAAAREDVAMVCEALGYTAGRTVLESIVAMPRRLLQPALKAVKAAHAAAARGEQATHRTHVVVHATGALVAQDSTHTGSSGGRKAFAEVVHDRATLATTAIGNGKPITAEAVLAQLRAWAAENRLPLVWSTDNGPAYRDEGVAAVCRELQVLHLRSRRHTPQDNAGVEHGIGEGKAEANLGRGVDLDEPVEGVARLDAGFQRLNARPRATRGGLSADDLTARLPRWDAFVDRETFYAAGQAALQRAASGALQDRARRQAEREATVQTLERFGLVSRTRGGRPLTALKPEMIS